MSLDFKSSVLICSNLLLNQLFLKLNSLLQSAISHHTSSMKVIKPSCLHAARETALGMQNTEGQNTWRSQKGWNTGKNCSRFYSSTFFFLF